MLNETHLFVLVVRKNISLNTYNIILGDIGLQSTVNKEADENKYVTSLTADSAAQYCLPSQVVRKSLWGFVLCDATMNCSSTVLGHKRKEELFHFMEACSEQYDPYGPNIHLIA